MDTSKVVKMSKVKRGGNQPGGYRLNFQAPPEMALRMMQIMGHGAQMTMNSEGRLMLSGGDDEETVAARFKQDFIDTSTIEQSKVIDFFLETVGHVQTASTFEQFEILADDIDDDLEMEYGRNPLPEVDLCEGNRVTIETLYRDIREQLLGKFLLCRTITRAMNGAWLEVVVEDPSGKTAAILRLKNYTPPTYSLAVTKAVGGERIRNGVDWFEWLPPGSYLAVKNVFASAAEIRVHGVPSSAVICCFNPAQVVLLSSKKMKELFPEMAWKGSVRGEPFWDGAGKNDAEIMETLKRKGNTAFVTKRYTDALRWYDLALEYVGNDNSSLVNIWSNKTAAFIGLGCFLRALMSCDRVLAIVPDHVKVIYRKMKALVGLGRMDEAETFLKDKLAHHPALMENDDLRGLMENKPWKESVEDLENKDVLGKMEKLENPNKEIMKDLDFRPDYVGPIECRPSSSTSCRGVFATEDISPGQLLVSHRCFAHVGDRDWMPKRTLDPIPNKLVGNELVGIIANKVAFSPELGKEIYKLWAGNKMKILDGNDDSQNMKVLMTRIQKIVTNNALFECNHFHPSNAAGVSTIGAQLDHTCVDANVMVSDFEPFFKLRSTKFIKKGERLLMRYYTAHQRLEYRKQMMKKVGRTCNCRFCQFEGRRNITVENTLDKFYSELNSIEARDYKRNRRKVDTALEIVRQLEQLHADAPDLNTMMLDTSIRNTLCDALFKRGLFQEFVSLCEKIFTVAKTVSEEVAMDAATNVMKGYMELKNKSKAKEWYERANECSFITRIPCPYPIFVSKKVRDELSAGKITVLDLLDKIGED